jgi:L-ribulose-5-phosphate 3-epimerase
MSTPTLLSPATRREFLQRLTLLGSSLALLPCKATAATVLPPGIQLSLGQWVFHRSFRGEPGVEKLDPIDFPTMAGELGFTGVDYSGQLWATRADDPKFQSELRRRAADAGVQNVVILVDAEGALGASNTAERQKAIARHTRWLDIAAALGCAGIRVNPQSDSKLDADEQAKLLADGVSQLTERAAHRGLDVMLENHGEGLSCNGPWIARVVRLVNDARCGTLPDFGNFHRNRARNEWHDRYAGVAAMLPFAKMLCAKSHAFDAEGNEIYTDYERMLRMALDGGFRGFIEVEYEGAHKPGIEPPRRAEPFPIFPPRDGALATKQLIERTFAKLARDRDPTDASKVLSHLR